VDFKKRVLLGGDAKVGVALPKRIKLSKSMKKPLWEVSNLYQNGSHPAFVHAAIISECRQREYPLSNATIV
jgi:hypothetical protein